MTRLEPAAAKMSQYHFIKCCCFQLCNVFRSRAMEIDQCLLESLPLGQRLRLVRRMRCDQVRAYCERERALQRQARPRARPPTRRRPKVRFGTSDIIQDAIVRHDDKEVLQLLKEGANPTLPTPSGGSLLHLCARHDNAFAAELLVERGLNVNGQDEELWTALHVACACDSTDVLLLLLLAGANVLLQDVNGNIPLDYATEGSEAGHILLQHLEEHGLDAGTVRHVKMQAASAMLLDVRQLVATGGSVNQCNDEGVTLLHIACASGFNEVISLLLENGAEPHVADNSFWTPLHLAAKYGQTGAVRQLLTHHADPTLLNGDEAKPSDVAASDHIADMLLRAEACWEERLRNPSAPPLVAEEDDKEAVQDVFTAVRKLNPLALPISKRDSLFEKDVMFRDVPGAMTPQPAQENGLDGHFPSGAGKLEQVKLVPPAPSDDLASLSDLTDSSLLYEMQKRFGNDQIYTYIGYILLLINPNKDLPIYSPLVSQLYLSSSGRLCSSLPPHIFSSAERAYHMMLQENQRQCFILSGESGSGKTEACKHIVRHLAVRSGPKGFSLEPRMKHVNCILEAFGHAKTRMNSNSSRFMKFLSLQYCEKKKSLIRAQVYTYALEKSRLVSSEPQQQNFCIFYLMAEGMSAEEKSTLHLSNILTHRYLRQGGSVERPAVPASVQGRERLSVLKQALRALGFHGVEVENLFVILGAILHLGDLCFTALTDSEASIVADLQLLETVSSMLQVCPEDLGSALTSDVQFFKGDVITRQRTVEMSNHNRDLLAKSLYSRLFGYLVNNINCYLNGQEESSGHAALEIGVLDIFGFEESRENSFEQLCINMTNEKIHRYVMDLLFHQEQAECLQEGVAMETLSCPGNNSGVLDFFFQKPQGLLAVLDEENQALHPSEQNLYKTLQSQLLTANANGIFYCAKDGNGNPPPKDQGPSFTVGHYAGKVTYDLTGSLKKNKDTLPQNILFVLKSSENVVIHQAFQSKVTQTGSLVPPQQRLKALGPKSALLLQRVTPSCPAWEPKKYPEVSKLLKKKGGTSFSFLQRSERGGPVTVAAELRNSLSEIISKLQGSTPHFIQCVRPNGTRQPNSFDSHHVSTQLQYVGVLDMVRTIHYGYPVRLPFASFLTRYKDLADAILGDGELSVEDKCRHILQHCKLQGWQMGHTKVFLRYWQADHLNDRCHQLNRKVIICQKVVRGWLGRRHLRFMVRARQQQREHQIGQVENFLQGVEDLGLQAYHSLVIQNASDIARHSDHRRGHLSSTHLPERPEPLGREEEPPKRAPEKAGKPADGTICVADRPLRHFRSSSMSSPLTTDLVLSTGLLVKHPSQLLAGTEEGGVGGCLSSPRKQPPPKPKRDPNTRLSASYEAVSACLSMAVKDAEADALSKPRPHSDDYSTMKKIPPPKPKRSPYTKLTGSYEEISATRPMEVKLSCRGGHCLGPIQRVASADGPRGSVLSLYRSQEDDVYMEMVGHPGNTSLVEVESPEQGEAVYEEMKYFLPEEGALQSEAPLVKPEGSNSPHPLEGKRLMSAELCVSPGPGGWPPGKDGPCDIPPPFPNLLPHRPPLLVFPPSPVTCSPASDESPLTPLEVKKLPVMEPGLGYGGQGEAGGPLSPQYPRQRADSTPSLSVFVPDKSTPPLTPPPPPPPPFTPSYRTPSHFPFPPETVGPHLTRAASVATPDHFRVAHKSGHPSAEAPPSSGKPPHSPVKTGWPEPRRAHSCSSSPLLFNPVGVRPLSSPLDELTTLFSSGRSLLRKSAAGKKIRELGFNINQPDRDRDDVDTTPPSPQLQDKNANNHVAPIPIENGNRLSSGALEESHSKANLHRHRDSHHSQVIQKLRMSRDEHAALQELLAWRRKLCEERRFLRGAGSLSDLAVTSAPPPPRVSAPTPVKKAFP
ncbi:unconventional myosin-XVI isoform X1 [Paramormyrops kingsleyae]|uniref:unconventional myosin-XVI isoform X1 n=2 Tax=Paramormyrops kingsleyae TaxID=1676925 RepID=UPI003B96B12F